MSKSFKEEHPLGRCLWSGTMVYRKDWHFPRRNSSSQAASSSDDDMLTRGRIIIPKKINSVDKFCYRSAVHKATSMDSNGGQITRATIRFNMDSLASNEKDTCRRKEGKTPWLRYANTTKIFFMQNIERTPSTTATFVWFGRYSNAISKMFQTVVPCVLRLQLSLSSLPASCK